MRFKYQFIKFSILFRQSHIIVTYLKKIKYERFLGFGFHQSNYFNEFKCDCLHLYFANYND